MKQLLIIFCLLNILTTSGQDASSKFYLNGSDTIYTTVDKPAQPANGMEKFYKKVSSNLKYPKDAKRNSVTGNVFVQFLVASDGKLSNFKVVKGIGSGCDEEAIRVLEMAERWIPATKNGRPVNSRFNKVIIFQAN